MNIIRVIIMLLLATVQVAKAQVAGHEYARVASNDSLVHFTDDEFYKIARVVSFPINQFEIAENSDFYHELVDEIIPEMNAANYCLSQIILRGASSPEGPHPTNVFLANKRQEALFSLIDSNMTAPSCDDCISVIETPADYNLLLRLMRKAHDEDYGAVNYVVRKHKNDHAALKRELLSIEDGELWLRLFNKYFGHLRYARVVLVFKKCDKAFSRAYDNALESGSLLGKLNTSNINFSEKVGFIPAIPEFLGKVKMKRYPLLSVKSNLLYDFFYTPKTGFQPMPDIEAEYYFRNGKYAVLAEYQFPWWSNEEMKEFFQMQNWQLEPRYYFNHDHYFNGLYVGAYANYNRFDFALKGNDGSGVQGEGAGAGVSAGYVLPIGKKTSRFKFEFNLKAGYYETHYDPYDYEYNVETQTGKYYYRWWDSPTAFRRRNWRYRWVGPTGAGIKISYDLFRRKTVKD